MKKHFKKSNWDEILLGEKTLKGLFNKKDLNKLREDLVDDIKKVV